MLPCSPGEVLFEIKLGIAVPNMPMPDTITVAKTRKTPKFWNNAMRNRLGVINSVPAAISFPSPTLLASLPTMKP